jgi:uncharacterized protein (TIGR02186 family)
MRSIAAILAAFWMAQAAAAETVVLGLSQNEVAITANFDGSRLLIFGAIRREVPIPDTGTLDVIVTVTGPETPVDVFRKERRFGIWVNADRVRLPRAPSFYAVASSGPIEDILSATENLRHRITVDHAVRTVGAREAVEDVTSFTDALVRIRSRDELFQQAMDGVAVEEQTLFRTTIDLPANLVEGDYRTRIFLLRDRSVIDVHETSIDVRKVGLERFLFNLSQAQPLVYGIMSLVIAVAAGWLASALFRAFQR